MNVKRHWNLSGGSNDFKVWLKDSIFCAINLGRPHFDRSDCARLGWWTQVNLCHPAGAIYDISDFVADTKTEPPPPTHNMYPHKPHWLVLIRDERKSRRVVSEKRNCTNPLGSAVHAGYSRNEFHSLLSLTPVFPTPGNYWHSSCSHDAWRIAPGGQPNHRLCQSSSLLYISLFLFSLTHPVFYSPVALSPFQDRTHSLIL